MTKTTTLANTKMLDIDFSSAQVKMIQHIYRRMGIGSTLRNIEDCLEKTAEEIVDDLLDKAKNATPLEEPYYKDYGRKQINADKKTFRIIERQLRARWFEDAQSNPLLQKLILFWQNHFVTQYSVYRTVSMLFEYHNCIHKHAIGNFKEFVREIGLTGAMLIYLNGQDNVKDKPNENYARELFELFTLGEGNGYTQEDIIETARALTGNWVRKFNVFEVIFVNKRHDADPKTIFGNTGNWDYDDVIDILFETRKVEIAKFICEKLYTYFISPISDQNTVDELADVFLSNDFELYPVLEQLFKVDTLYKEENRGVFVKSHVDYNATFANEFGYDLSQIAGQVGKRDNEKYSFNYSMILYRDLAKIGQDLYDPVDVAGWPGNRSWLTGNTMVSRWELADKFINMAIKRYSAEVISFAKTLSGNSADPEVVTRAIVDYFIQPGLSSSQSYSNAVARFKFDVPTNYFESGQWNLDWNNAKYQIQNLLQFVVRQPEFMLY